MAYSWETTSTNPNISDAYYKNSSALNIVEPNLSFIDSFMKEISSDYALDSKFFKIHDNHISIRIFDTLIKTSIKISKEKSFAIYSDLSCIEKDGKDYIVSMYQTKKDVISIFNLNYTNNVHSNNVLINNFPLYTSLNSYIGMVYMPNKSILIVDKTCYMNLDGKIVKKNIDNYNDLIEIITKHNLNYKGIFNRYI